MSDDELLAGFWARAEPDERLATEAQRTGKNYIACMLVKLRPDLPDPTSVEAWVWYRPDLDAESQAKVARDLMVRLNDLQTYGRDGGNFTWQERSDGLLQVYIVQYELDAFLSQNPDDEPLG